MIYGRLLSRKIYLFTDFYLAASSREPEIFNASKPFAIFSKKYFLKKFFPDSDYQV